MVKMVGKEIEVMVRCMEDAEKTESSGEIQKMYKEMFHPENRVLDILYKVVPGIVEEANQGIWDDYYLKTEILELWLKASLLNYGLAHGASEEFLEQFFEKINKRMRPYRDEDISSFDKRYVETVKDLIKEERRRFLWEPFFDNEMIDKQFVYACDRM